MEVIINIISFLNEIDDLRSCFLLSKEIRDLIFKTPEIMRKIQIHFNQCNWVNIPLKKNNVWNSNPNYCHDDSLVTEPQVEFLENRGKFIRCLAFKTEEKFGEIFKFILNQVPNLEEFDFQILDPKSEGNEIFDISEQTPDLSRLKTLKTNNRALNFLIKNTKNVKNLQNLSIISPQSNSQEILTDFLIQQENLQEFSLRFATAMDIINFPTRDITNEVKFHLKKLKLCFVNGNRKHFIDFLQTQAESVDELELNYKPHEEILDVVFTKFKNLSKWTLNIFGDSPVFSEFYPHWQLPNMKKYIGRSYSGVDLKNVYSRFPNLEYLWIWKLIDTTEIFSKLTSLDVGLLYSHKLENLKLPGLKNLKVFIYYGYNHEPYWVNFAKNNDNIQNLTIKDFQDTHDVTFVVKNLNIFKNLKTFKIGSCRRIGYGDVMGVDITSVKDQQFFNMIIDTERKTIKTSKFISIKYPDIIEILLDNFRGFECIELSLHKPKVIQVGADGN